ncbi:MAG: methyltransferase RsmF C-terminal domain-like protein [Bacteroidia bacterium]
MEPRYFPKDFLVMMQSRLGNEFEAFAAALNETPPTSIRINPAKGADLFADEEQIPWCKFGRYLKERPSYVWDPLYHAGAYYSQEASSMLFANAIDFSRDLKVLDLCAAPGGKSSLVQSMMSKNSLLVSNEMVGKRVNILYENLVKWGGQNAVVTCNRSSDFLPFQGLFDVVLVDAPCSGEGMFRKDEEAVNQWNDGLVRQCSAIQKTILDDAIRLVAENGLLIYSTCTFEAQENEDNVERLYQKYGDILEPVELPSDPSWGLFEVEISTGKEKKQKGYYCFPHRVKGEGLFLSVMRVKASVKGKFTVKNQSVIRKASIKEKEIVKAFADTGRNETEVYLHGDKAFLGNPVYAELYSALAQNLYIRKVGTTVGQLKNNMLIPDPEIALSQEASPNIPRVALSFKEALDFQQRKNIILPPETPKGWVIFTYEGVELGWAKNLGNRVNTHYPSEWRIRKEPTKEFLESKMGF